MTSGRPFRFGVMCEHPRSRDELLLSATTAEAQGYATFLIRDHFIDEPFGPQLGPLATLATVAAHTTRIRVGTHVLCNDFRHPVELAKEAATIDLLSGGRFELGLGAGFAQEERERSGRTLDPAATRVARLEESVDLLKGLFGPVPTTFSGAYYRVRDLDTFPKPVQRPHPPILLGGAGRRMLSVAARKADIVGIQAAITTKGAVSGDSRGRFPETVDRKIGWIRDAAGARFDRIELSSTIALVISEDRVRAAAALARARGWTDVTPETILTMPSVFIGSVEQVADEMRARRERYGFSYFVVSEKDRDAAAPVIAHLAGA